MINSMSKIGFLEFCNVDIPKNKDGAGTVSFHFRTSFVAAVRFL